MPAARCAARPFCFSRRRPTLPAVLRPAFAVLPLAFCLLPSPAAEIKADRPAAPTNGFRPLIADDRPAQPRLASASREAEARLKQFRLAPGLKVDLWAAEPMLANPVAFAVDERGRVFTSETYRYRTSALDIRHYMFMLEDDLAARTIKDRLAMIRKWFGPEGEAALSRETEVIRLLEDTDGDGRADKSLVFAEGFTSPLSGIGSGVLARRGEVWFTETPSLWRISPTNVPAQAAAVGQAGAVGQAPPPVTRPPGAPPGEPTAGVGARPTEPAGAADPLRSTPRVMDGYQAVELLRGFGVRFSFTGHDLHGLKLGPDGRLYFSVGDRGAHIVTQEGTVIDLPDEGAVFRCEPDGSRLEVVHRGLRNPQELAFNEYGDLFTGDNDSDQGDRERWVQVVEGGDSGWRVGHQHAPLGHGGMWNLERLWVPHFPGQAAYIIPPIANIGDGPGGLVHDYTGHYAAGTPGQPFVAYATKARAMAGGGFLLAYFKGTSAQSGICSLKLRPAGAGYELVAHDEFIWNTLVTDVDFAPDGAVFFTDWHEGWPKSNKGRLYRAYFPEVLADPAVKETAKLLAEGFAQRDEQELLGLLAHRDMRVRQEAQFELVGRGTNVIAAMFSLAGRAQNTPLARFHSIWGIGQMARNLPVWETRMEILNGLIPLLRDRSADIRYATSKALDQRVSAKVAEALLDRLTDDEPRVRRAAAIALSRQFYDGQRIPRSWPFLTETAIRLAEWAKPMAGRAAIDRLRIAAQADAAGGVTSTLGRLADVAMPEADEKQFVRTVVSAIAETSPNPALRNAISMVLAELATCRREGYDLSYLIKDERREVREVTLMAMRRFRTPVISQFLSDPDPLLILEAARAINDVPISNALPALAELAGPARLDAVLKQFAALAAVGQAPPPVIRPPGAPPGEAAAGGGARRTEPAGAAGPPPIRDVRADQPLPWGDAPPDHLAPLLLRVVNANFRTGTPASAARLAALAARTDLPELVRTEAVFALGSWAAPHPRDRITGTFRPLPARDAAPAREALMHVVPALAGTGRLSADDRTVPPEGGTTNALFLTALAEAAASLQLTDAAPSLAALVRRMDAPAAARVAALRSFAQIENRKSEIENLLAFASNDAAEPLRLEVSKLNAALNPGDAAGQLAAKLAAGTEAEQQAAYAALGGLKDPAADALLADALDKLMKRELPNEVALDVVEAAGKRDADAVKSRLAAYQDWKLPKDHLTPHREALFGGDVERGRKVFYGNATVACTRCHQIGNDGGGNAGPRLDGVATRLTREALLESIVAPNRQITEGYETALVTLKNGAVLAGLVKSETDTELVLHNPEDGDLTVKKADLELREAGLSGMPEGFADILTRQELRDVIEFLGTLK
jgi:quinoprotein glucose dehydrogenase